MTNELIFKEKAFELEILIEVEKVDDEIKKHLQKLPNVFSSFIKEELKQDTSGHLALTICHSDKIRAINSEHRNKDKVTDVLSFPLQESVRNGVIDVFSSQIELGDILICYEVAKKQADEFKISIAEEISHLAIHGFLHLCGFDHEISKQEEELMEKHEALLLQKLSSDLK